MLIQHLKALYNTNHGSTFLKVLYINAARSIIQPLSLFCTVNYDVLDTNVLYLESRLICFYTYDIKHLTERD